MTTDQLPAAKAAFCDFIGQRAFESDGGWSFEVWQAAWDAALKHNSEVCNMCGSLVMISKQPDLPHVPKS